MAGELHWNSPMIYLFGGMFLVFSLIACALIILACSYKKPYLAYTIDDGGKPSSPACKTHLSSEMEPQIVITMPGDTDPTYLAMCLPPHLQQVLTCTSMEY
ncbi:hypothetical protein L1987_18007 [Smallanthus sonchifolius]|uniref:Uncharacterized protein n=1 Tax=Smallanthus sonchifolius TaxID=185202 RepID=A0ACB9IZL6_9ASTR|nr:hypothetical protein L1987_18007 [Smallanthus sonchifolius]